jgi:excisionase family DNA binding protein
MDANPKLESPGRTGQLNAAQANERLLTRKEVAAAMTVSLRTVDRMLADGEIKSIRLRGRVRFHLSEVFEDLAATARTRKRGPGKERA